MQPIFILEPAALIFLAAGGQLVPQIVHFLLRLTVYEQRDGFGEGEMQTSIEGTKSLAFKLEVDSHYCSFFPAFRAGTRPDDRDSRSRIAGSSPPTRQCL
jgi:hypothetical protein